MAAHSCGGWITHLGFGTLASLLLVVTLQGFAAVRRGETVRHRELTRETPLVQRLRGA